MKIKILACVALILASGCQQSDSQSSQSTKSSKSENTDEQSVAGDYFSAQMGKAVNPYGKGMVAAANPHATRAGVEALRNGGTAMDAALAVQTVLGLVEPQSSGIGGGAFIIYYDAATGKVTAYNGREKAPIGADEYMFTDPDHKPIRKLDQINSGLSTGVPGAVAVLNMAHQDHGKLEWADGLSFATKLAEDGFEVSPRLAKMLELGARYGLKDQGAARQYFYDENGEPWPQGHVLKNPAYAQTLKSLAQTPRHFYEGPIAEGIVATVKGAPRPGTLSLIDLKNYKPIKSDALCSPYRTYTLCSALPPSSGGVAVQSIMGQLQNFNMADLGPSLEGWHVFAEASAQSYADRDQYVADPDFVVVPTLELLDPDYLESRAKNIKMDKANPNVVAGDLAQFKHGKDATGDTPGTSHFSIVDKWGNVVSMTTTIEGAFGSKRMTGGFLLNNQLTDFSASPVDEHGILIANRPGPNKRPRSSMAPTIAFDDDGTFAFATGSPGGSSIIAYTAKTIVAMVDWGMSPQEAAALVNVISRNGSVRIEEAAMSEPIMQGLEDMGHKVVRSKGETSGIHIIRRKADGSYEGAADPRREGTVESE